MLHDDFEYPMPKRETNWTLGKEESRGKRAQRAQSDAPRPVNRTTDIEGAASGTTALYRARQFGHKPNLFDNSDISGASPKRHIPEKVNKEDRNLNTRDIDYSYPVSKLFSTPRVVDPLSPSYRLPRVNNRPPTPVEKKHDTMKISDIEGTKPKRRYTRSQERNPLDYSDVPKSTAGSSTKRMRSGPSSSLQTIDIQHEHLFKTNRVTNPLEPVYKLDGIARKGTSERVQLSVGDIEGSHPRKIPNQRHDSPLFSLRSDDIAGASPGDNVPYPKQRREWKKTCDVSDISTKGKPLL